MKKISGPVKPLTPRMSQVVQFLFEHPQMTQQQIGEAIGISNSRVSEILRCNRVLAAFPMLARARLKSMVPDAVRAQAELIAQSRDLNVRDKASSRLLESQGILDKQPVVIRHELEIMPTEKVVERVRDSLKLSAQDVYDAEIIPPDGESTDEVA